MNDEVDKKDTDLTQSNNDSAAHNPKDASSSQEPPSMVSTSNTSDVKKPKIRKIKKKSIIAIIIGIIVIAILGIVFIKFTQSNSYAVKVGDTVLSKSDYELYKDTYQNYGLPLIVSEENFNNYVIDAVKNIEAARQEDKPISDDDISIFIKENYGESQAKDPWLVFVAKSEIAEQSLSNLNGGNYYAELYFPFSRSFVVGNLTPEMGYGNEQQIADDEKYAKEQAELYIAQLKQNTDINTAKQIIESIVNDDRLSTGFSNNNSAVFSLDQNNDQRYEDDNILETDDSQKNIITSLTDDNPISEVVVIKRGGTSSIEKYNSVDQPIMYAYYAKLKDQADSFDLVAFKANVKVDNNIEEDTND